MIARQSTPPEASAALSRARELADAMLAEAEAGAARIRQQASAERREAVESLNSSREMSDALRANARRLLQDMADGRRHLREQLGESPAAAAYADDELDVPEFMPGSMEG